MPRFLKKRSHKAGLPPGTIVPSESAGTRDDVKVFVMDYNEAQFQERETEKVEECFPYKDSDTVTWINVDGIHDVDVLQKLGTHFGMHPLSLEDVASTGQRPKLEDFESYLLIILNMIDYDSVKGEITSEQISIVVTNGSVISFQERRGDVFEGIRERIRTAKGRIRKMGSDYLAYALLDSIVDNYFVVLEKLGEKIEAMEDKVVSDPSPKVLQEIHHLKGETLFLRKSVWPLRELTSNLERTESSLIKESTSAYLRDLYGHTIQVMETIDTFREIIGGMRDTYLSSISNRMNEVMKVLTIIATIFIPITFVAGIYGMNFSSEASPWNMPELGWRYGYVGALAVMAAIAIGMLVYFRKKQWL